MCFGGGGSSKAQVPAQPTLAPNLPPQILALSEAARSQISGGGTGLSDLRINVNAPRNMKSKERMEIR